MPRRGKDPLPLEPAMEVTPEMFSINDMINNARLGIAQRRAMDKQDEMPQLEVKKNSEPPAVQGGMMGLRRAVGGRRQRMKPEAPVVEVNEIVVPDEVADSVGSGAGCDQEGGKRGRTRRILPGRSQKKPTEAPMDKSAPAPAPLAGGSDKMRKDMLDRLKEKSSKEKKSGMEKHMRSADKPIDEKRLPRGDTPEYVAPAPASAPAPAPASGKGKRKVGDKMKKTR